MNAAAILRHKGSTVVTVTGDLTLHDAAKSLDDKQIGAVVVTDASGAIQGVLSERDIAREIARHGASALKSAISAAMTKDVDTVTPATTIDEMMARMTSRRIRHLPVLEEGRLVGIVSIGDVVKRKIETIEADAAALRDYITTS